eukprot:8073308-Ditylum_brightwellii.AAC.1
MIALVAKHAPKNKMHCTSTSLKNREWNCFFSSIDNTCNKCKSHEKQHDTKLKRTKEAMQKMKDEYTKVKKDQDEGH